MRQITEKAVLNFKAGTNFKESNTEVLVRDNLVSMYLFGNLIARRHIDSGLTEVTLAGWNSVTTRERLNGLGAYVYQKNYTPYIKIGGKDIEMGLNNFYVISHTSC